MNQDSKNLGYGLLPTTPDLRDFSYSKVFGAVPPPELDFMIASPLEIKDQKDSDMCTAFALCAMSEAQERVILEPAYIFQKTKMLLNNLEWGADLRTPCKVATKYGFLEGKDSPYSLDTKDRDFVADWKNWDIMLDEKAAEHKKQSYFSIDGGLDFFDSVRIALWMNREEKRAVFTGCYWRPGWIRSNGIIPKEPQEGGFGHAFVFIGQKKIEDEIYLIAQLSNGLEIGDKGLFYFPREVVNREFIWGGYTFRDLDPEVVKRLAKKSRFSSLFSFIVGYLREIFR